MKVRHFITHNSPQRNGQWQAVCGHWTDRVSDKPNDVHKGWGQHAVTCGSCWQTAAYQTAFWAPHWHMRSIARTTGAS